jgi:hypothetical protein
MYYMLGYSQITSLARAAQEHGASESELACIRRLQDFEAEWHDVERLIPLAGLAGVDLPERAGLDLLRHVESVR